MNDSSGIGRLWNIYDAWRAKAWSTKTQWSASLSILEIYLISKAYYTFPSAYFFTFFIIPTQSTLFKRIPECHSFHTNLCSGGNHSAHIAMKISMVYQHLKCRRDISLSKRIRNDIINWQKLISHLVRKHDSKPLNRWSSRVYIIFRRYRIPTQITGEMYYSLRRSLSFFKLF